MIDTAHREEFLRSTELFKDLSEQQIAFIIPYLKEKHVPAGGEIIQEGTPADNLYILISGEAEVVKKESDSDVLHGLSTLGPGEVLGELAFLDQGMRSASVMAKTDCYLWELRIEDLSLPNDSEQSGAVGIRLSIARQLSQRFRIQTEKTIASLKAQIQEQKARVALGIFLCTILFLNSGYVLALNIASTFSKSSADTAFISLPMLLFFAAGIFIAMKRSGYPFSMYGLTLKNWKTSVIDSCLLTIPILLLIVLAKMLLIHYHPAMQQSELFELARHYTMSPAKLLLVAALYAIFTPIQEIIARGGIQGSFQAFLAGKDRKWTAIFMANLIFSMSHIHMSPLVVLMVFPVGMFWGWMYARHGTMIGVCLSHTIVGIFAFYVVGFYYLLH